MAAARSRSASCSSRQRMLTRATAALARFLLVTLQPSFGQSGSLEDVYRHHGLDTDSIVRAALDLVG